MEKINMTIGRFQPFTQGHLNMINEGEAPCIIYRINSSGKMPETLKGFKVANRVIKPESVKNVVNYIDTLNGDLTEQEKELLKRPFTNELIEKELEIVKKSNKNIVDVVPVVNAFEAVAKFNKFILDNKDKYEPQYWMCGDDRVDNYTDIINKTKDEGIAIVRDGELFENVIKGKLKTNTGKGRTEGVSGTAVRKAILNKDKSAFEKIMPKGVGSMFDEFVEAFDKFKGQLQTLIKENKILKNYINNNMKTLSDFINEGKSGTIDQFFDVISDLFINPGFDEFWKTKIKSHFKRNKSIFKAIDYYDKWRDLLDDDLGDIYQSRNGWRAKDRMIADVKKYDKELSAKLFNNLKL